MELFVRTKRRSDKIIIAEIFCEFLIDHLGIRNSRYHLGLISHSYKNERAGEVVHDDIGIAVFIDTRKSHHEFLHAIAHEMVHVKQIARGALRLEGLNTDEFTIWWRGKSYTAETLPPYLERPWELQALREETVLVRLFEEHLFNEPHKDDTILKRGKEYAIRKV